MIKTIFGLFKKDKVASVGLALGGGSVRGVAHIGLLKSIEKHKIPIACLSGTSAGSIVAGLYAAGVPLAVIEHEIVYKFMWLNVVVPNFGNSLGLFSTRKLQKMLSGYLPVKTFGETNIPLAVSASDLVSGTEYIFRKSHEPLATAITASCSVPGLFAPTVYDGKILVDGCLVNNVPTSALKSFNPNYIIGANVVPPVSMPGSPEGFFSVMSRMHDIYQLHAHRYVQHDADLLLQLVPEYISVLKPSKKLYKQLIDNAEKIADKYLPRVLS